MSFVFSLFFFSLSLSLLLFFFFSLFLFISILANFMIQSLCLSISVPCCSSPLFVDESVMWFPMALSLTCTRSIALQLVHISACACRKATMWAFKLTQVLCLVARMSWLRTKLGRLHDDVVEDKEFRRGSVQKRNVSEFGALLNPCPWPSRWTDLLAVSSLLPS